MVAAISCLELPLKLADHHVLGTSIGRHVRCRLGMRPGAGREVLRLLQRRGGLLRDGVLQFGLADDQHRRASHALVVRYSPPPPPPKGSSSEKMINSFLSRLPVQQL